MFHHGTLFGWKRSDGARRFRTSYLEVARKNGKSTWGAGAGLYLFIADGEPGAEVYTAATKKDQARIIWSESMRMVKQSPDLKQIVGVFKDNLHVDATFSKMEPVGRDSDTLDGLNVHGALIDELHAHPTGEMWDVLETATGARRQPLMIAVTTAGHDRQSICFQFHDYTEKVLSGVIEDDAWHGAIYTLDRDHEGVLEDWQDERVWVKANPNLGISKKASDLRDKARKAGYLPARLNVFLQKELNIWTQAATRWIHPEVWRDCFLREVDEERLAGRRCFGALDLSSTLDLTAWALVFPPEPGDTVYDVVMRFWIPEDNLLERVKMDRVPYDAWLRAGLIETTPGNVVDYDWILNTVKQHGERYKIEEIAFDPWNATSVSNKLMDAGANMIEFRQGFASMSPAMKALEVAIKQRTLNHGGHPVLAWMADNLVASMDPAGNVKPDKGKSTEKIDGMVALLMAFYRAQLQQGERVSVYEGRGLRVL